MACGTAVGTLWVFAYGIEIGALVGVPIYGETNGALSARPWVAAMAAESSARSPLLLRNDQRLGHHWLRLKLVGGKSNRDAIGAWVRVRVDGRTLSQQVMPTKGYLSQSELVLTFGLGAATRVDTVEITWPGGAVQKVAPVRIDAVNVVREGK